MLTKNSPEQLARRRAMHSQLTSFLVIISYYLYDNLVAMEYLGAKQNSTQAASSHTEEYNDKYQ